MTRGLVSALVSALVSVASEILVSQIHDPSKVTNPALSRQPISGRG